MSRLREKRTSPYISIIIEDSVELYVVKMDK